MNKRAEILREMAISVSLRSIIHSYGKKLFSENFDTIDFPSPYGVSFIFIWLDL